jgi:ATP adenylyltransferase
MAYLRQLERKAQDVGWSDVSSGNFFLDYWRSPQDDQPNYVVYRNQNGIILLNRYPYANGHLLVALGEPKPTLLDYDATQRSAFWSLTEMAMRLMRDVLEPQGINLGINEGRAAGAGVPEHLHAHLVPRWAGDTNFMSVTGQVRVVPDSLESMTRQYRQAVEDQHSDG